MENIKQKICRILKKDKICFLITFNINIFINYKKKIIKSIYIDNIIYITINLWLFDKFEDQLKEKLK